MPIDASPATGPGPWPDTRPPRERLACVIVTHNRANQLRCCLEKTLHEAIDLVVVIDNASTDTTPELLAELQAREPRLLVERQRRNRGGAWGFARGMRLADHLLGRKGWLLLFDDDSWPESGCIARFRSHIAEYQRDGIAGVGAAVFAADGQAVEANRPVMNLFRRPAAVLAHTATRSSSLRDVYHVPHSILKRSGHQLDVDSISFVGLFLNLEVLPAGRARYPRGGLFIYSDDTTYTLQLGRLGLRRILDTDLIFRHDTLAGGASTPWLKPTWKHYYVVRNSFLMNHALSRLWYLPLCTVTILIHTVKGLLLLLREKDWTLLTMVRLGVWDGMRNYYYRSQEELKARCAAGSQASPRD